jgi:hypothetical protein
MGRSKKTNRKKPGAQFEQALNSPAPSSSPSTRPPEVTSAAPADRADQPAPAYRDSRTLAALRQAQTNILRMMKDEDISNTGLKTAAEEAPVMLRLLSLGPALAQLLAKGKERAQLGDSLAKSLGFASGVIALNAIPSMSRAEYRLHALRAADYLLAMKRLAQAYLSDPGAEAEKQEAINAE